MWDWGAIRLGYHDHYVVDGGKRRIILAALVTPADVMESQADAGSPVAVLLSPQDLAAPRHRAMPSTARSTTLSPSRMPASTPICPLTDFAHRTDFYGQDEFAFDPERDEYCCPERHPLPLHGANALKASWPTGQGPPSAMPSGRGQVHDQRPRPHIQWSFSRTTWRRCGATTGPRPTRRRCASGSMGRAALCRGQAVAWLTPARLRGLHERQHPGVADRGGPEPEALPGGDGWGRRHARCGSLLALPGSSFSSRPSDE